MLMATSAGALVNFLCNLFLIPRFAENGAAIATVMAEVVVATVSFINATRYFDMQMIFQPYYQYWLATVPIPIITMLLRFLSIHYVIRVGMTIILSCGCYFGILLLLKNEYLHTVIGIVLRKLGLKQDIVEKRKQQ